MERGQVFVGGGVTRRAGGGTSKKLQGSHPGLVEEYISSSQRGSALHRFPSFPRSSAASLRRHADHVQGALSAEHPASRWAQAHCRDWPPCQECCLPGLDPPRCPSPPCWCRPQEWCWAPLRAAAAAPAPAASGQGRLAAAAAASALAHCSATVQLLSMTAAATGSTVLPAVLNRPAGRCSLYPHHPPSPATCRPARRWPSWPMAVWI